MVKSFVRNGKIVDFPSDTRRLAESVGFQTVEVIHASLVKRTAEASLFGGDETKTKERKSFFRRLAEKKGSPRIDHEVVLIMVKPGEGEGRADCVVSSPPYAMEDKRGPGSHIADGDDVLNGSAGRIGRSCIDGDYGSTAGQLGSMPPGHIEDAL